MSTQFADIEKIIDERLKAATPSIKLYNPANEFVEQTVKGLIYVLPPDGYGVPPGEEQPQKYDGILEVKDQWGFSVQDLPAEQRKAALRRAGKNPAPNKVTLTAAEVVRHLLRKLSPRGIVFLTGDSGKDAKLKEQARNTWAEFQLKQAQQIVDNYSNRTRAWHLDPRNAGKFPPGMTERETLAQEVLDAHAAGKLDKYRFPCPERCGYGTNDEAKIEIHMKVAHPASMQRIQDEVVAETAPLRRGPGRPRKAQQPEA